MLGLITGSGFYNVSELEDGVDETVATMYGEVVVTRARWLGAHEVVFLARHGVGHSLAPHLINYRANIAALDALGVTAIVATAVSGAMAEGLDSGMLVAISDFLDFTKGRPGTFFDTPGLVQHTEMGTAYDPELRELVVKAAGSVGIDIVDGGTYCTFNGPRFESPAEIRMAAQLGGDLVGMTGYPEVVLARELGIAYASIGVISNRAAGMGAKELSLDEIMAVLARAAPPLMSVVGATIEHYYAAKSDPAKASQRMFTGEDIAAWNLTGGPKENEPHSKDPHSKDPHSKDPHSQDAADD